jgi:hypothetical protein
MDKRITAKELHEKHGRGLRAHKLETTPAADPIRGLLKMHRVSEYTTPIHNARTTREYSVSFPV